MALQSPAMKVTQKKRTHARNRRLAMEYAYGCDSIEQIASRHRLSKARVRQILAEPELQSFMDQLRLEREQEVRQHLNKYALKSSLKNIVRYVEDPNTPIGVQKDASKWVIDKCGNFDAPDVGVIIAGANVDPLVKVGEVLNRLAERHRQMGERAAFEEVPGDSGTQ